MSRQIGRRWSDRYQKKVAAYLKKCVWSFHRKTMFRYECIALAFHINLYIMTIPLFSLFEIDVLRHLFHFKLNYFSSVMKHQCVIYIIIDYCEDNWLSLRVPVNEKYVALEVFNFVHCERYLYFYNAFSYMYLKIFNFDIDMFEWSILFFLIYYFLMSDCTEICCMCFTYEICMTFVHMYLFLRICSCSS